MRVAITGGASRGQLFIFDDNATMPSQTQAVTSTKHLLENRRVSVSAVLGTDLPAIAFLALPPKRRLAMTVTRGPTGLTRAGRRSVGRDRDRQPTYGEMAHGYVWQPREHAGH